MEKAIIKNDIYVFYVTASSFPEGIEEAFNKLHAFLPASPPRNIFGLLRPENGGEIVYRAAAEKFRKGDAREWGCETLTIKSGNYISITVNEFKKDILAVGQAFEELLTLPNLDPNGFCVEVYDHDTEGYGTDQESVKCMIRLRE
jgi:hypothetical protein